ncbi:ISAs1 family transposase [Streptomyces sp. NPDC054904]
MCRQSATVCLVKPSVRQHGTAIGLAERLQGLADPRRRRGRRHPFVSVLLIAASAVLAGARSYAAIGQWAASADQHTLASLGARAVGALGVRVAPGRATIRRVLTLLTLACPGGLAELTGADPAGADAVAVDGKSARGSRNGETPAAHLLAAMTAGGQTISQLRVPAKTNEITCFAALLEPYDLTGVTVTADALHTQRDHARFLVEDKKAHYLLVVKANQRELHRRLRSLPWKDVTARRYDREIGHGRRETRATRAPHRHRPRPGLPSRRPSRAHPAAPHRPQERQGQPPGDLRDHRPDLTSGLAPTARPARPVTVDHREPAPLCA